eukprot:903674-Rhodomonas_salina.1
MTAPGSPAPFSDLKALFVDCEGPDSCPDCQASYKKACEIRSEITAELLALGWRTNEKESGLPLMCGEFICVPFDTDAFVFTITDAKRDKLHCRVLKCLHLDA